MDHVSPVDGVTYPGIAEYLPKRVTDQFHDNIEAVIGHAITPRSTFARVTHQGLSQAPHAVHCDIAMGRYGALVYLSPFPSEELRITGLPVKLAGTGFYRRVESQSRMWLESDDMETVNADANNLAAWELVELAEWKFNRCVIYDAREWHCALPMGGWGKDAESGRLVLTCFFDV